MIPDRGVKEWGEARLVKAQRTTRLGLAAFMTASRSPGTLYVKPVVESAGGKPRAVLVWRPDNELLPAAVVGARKVKARTDGEGGTFMLCEIGRIRVVIPAGWFDWWDSGIQGFWFDCANGSPVRVEMAPK